MPTLLPGPDIPVEEAMAWKRIVAALLIPCFLTLCAGCGLPESIRERLATLRNQGRSGGHTLDYRQDEAMETAFFRFEVHSARLAKDYGDYIPDGENRLFLILDATVTNTFEDSGEIPMFGSDFELTWDALGDTSVLAESNFADSQFPDEYSLFRNESRSGDLVFVVPADVSEFVVVFKEIWDDDFEGDTHRLHLSVEAPA